MSEDKLQIYENQSIRTSWDEKNEEWLFSVVDIIQVLTDKQDILTARKYWNKLKQRLKNEGSQLVTNCHQLRMVSQRDGKRYKTDVMNTEQILRLIQSVPSKKAEPFKLWLAKVGAERIDETIDPELAINRAFEIYSKKGYDKEWIQQRMLSIKVRNELTEKWQNRGMKKGAEYAILTDEISKAWSGMTTREYKNYKNLKKENLRDNMTNLELVLTMLSETTTTEISKTEKPQGLKANKKVAKRGGTIAGNARKDIERQTKKPVIIPNNKTQLSPDQPKNKKDDALTEP